VVDKISNTREGFKRISGELPVLLHAKIAYFNKISSRQINVSKLIENCIAQELKKIESQILEEIKDRDPELMGNDELHAEVLAKVDAEESASAIQLYVITQMLKGKEMEYVFPLLNVTTVKVSDNKRLIKFITDNEICFVLAPANVTFEDIKEIRKITL
jgi:hypothetical protein